MTQPTATDWLRRAAALTGGVALGGVVEFLLLIELPLVAATALVVVAGLAAVTLGRLPYFGGGLAAGAVAMAGALAWLASILRV